MAWTSFERSSSESSFVLGVVFSSGGVWAASDTGRTQTERPKRSAGTFRIVRVVARIERTDTARWQDGAALERVKPHHARQLGVLNAPSRGWFQRRQNLHDRADIAAEAIELHLGSAFSVEQGDHRRVKELAAVELAIPN